MAGDKTHELEIRNDPPCEPRSQSRQESRDHHEHNNAGQDGHKPQEHRSAQEQH